MTEEQKNKLIGKMIDNPASLSDKELELIIADEEIREIYEISSTLRGTISDEQEPDLDHEWELFRRRLHKNNSSSHWVMKVAAIFLGILLAGGLAVRLTDHFLTVKKTQYIAKTEPPLTSTVSTFPVYVKNDTAIVKEGYAPFPQKAQSAKKASVTKLEERDSLSDWQTPGDEIEAEEYMRIIEAKMDNELAIANGEIYMEKYKAMQDMLEYPDKMDKRILNIVMNLTLQ